MNVDDNWKETRLLAEDIDKLLGIPSETSEKYLTILSSLIIHKFLESLLDNESKAGTYQINLPYVGSLLVEINEKGQISTDFVVRGSFYKALKRAYTSHESPLVNLCTDYLSEDLLKRYKEGPSDE